MDRRLAVVALVWVWVLVDAVRQGYFLVELPHVNAWRFNALGIFAVLMPLLFFTTMAFWIKGYPFDVPPLRNWVNRRFGERSYERFMGKLRLMLLFSIGGLVIGGVGLFRAYDLQAPEGAFVVAGFFISAGIAFFVLRLILAKRGLSFE